MLAVGCNVSIAYPREKRHSKHYWNSKASLSAFIVSQKSKDLYPPVQTHSFDKIAYYSHWWLLPWSTLPGRLGYPSPIHTQSKWLTRPIHRTEKTWRAVAPILKKLLIQYSAHSSVKVWYDDLFRVGLFAREVSRFVTNTAYFRDVDDRSAFSWVSLGFDHGMGLLRNRRIWIERSDHNPLTHWQAWHQGPRRTPGSLVYILDLSWARH